LASSWSLGSGSKYGKKNEPGNPNPQNTQDGGLGQADQERVGHPEAVEGVINADDIAAPGVGK
jgi:hypothetical protein